MRHDYLEFLFGHVGRKVRESIEAATGRAVFDRELLVLDIA
jgi:hypothetical protein